MYQQTTQERIQQLRKNIALHSIIYYQFDSSVWSDSEYDNACLELVQLQKEFPEESKLAQHYEAFEDFTGETGFHLAHHPDFCTYEAKVRCLLGTSPQETIEQRVPHKSLGLGLDRTIRPDLILYTQDDIQGFNKTYPEQAFEDAEVGQKCVVLIKFETS